MPTPKVGATAVVNNGKIYVVGGRDGGTFIAPVYEYDSITDTWATRANIPTARESVGVVAIDGSIFTFGGSAPGLPTATMEKYDPISDMWTQLPDMPTVRNESFAALIDDEIFVFGGYDQWSMQSVSLQPVPDAGSTFGFLLFASSILFLNKSNRFFPASKNGV
jgi:N-acetylneuraminic acid mutarotase